MLKVHANILALAKRLAQTFAITALGLSAVAQSTQRFDFKQTQSNIRITDKSFDGLTIESSISYLDIVELNTKQGKFISISSDILTETFNPGFPNLPVISKLIEIPFGAQVVLKVVSFDEEIIEFG